MLQVALKKIHYDEQPQHSLVLLFRASNQVDKFRGMCVVGKFCQLPHELDLSNDLDCVIFTLANILYELDCDILFRHFAPGLNYLSVAALAYDLLKIVAVP